MFQLKGTSTFGEFYRSAYDATMVEPLATRFQEWSRAGNRQAMVEAVITLPCVAQSSIANSYRSKNDQLAIKLYEKARQLNEQTNDFKKDSKARKIIDEALFAASTSSKVFLDTLLQRANFSYRLGAFKDCIKDCQCMLAIPSSFYDCSPENASHFLECKNHCLALKSKCLETLESSHRNRRNGHDFSSRKKGTAACERKIQEKNSTNGPRKGNRESCGEELPAVHGNHHALLRSCSDVMDLQFDEKKGRHLVATKDINAGTVLIVDQPYSFSTDEDALDRNCLHCHTTLGLDSNIRIPCRSCQTVSFCSENCRKEAWRMYHELECHVFNYFFKVEETQQHRQTSHLLLAYRTTIIKLLDAHGARDSEKSAKSVLKIFLNNNFLKRGPMQIPIESKTADVFSPLTISPDLEKTRHKESSVAGNDCRDSKNEMISRETLIGLGTKTIYDPLDYHTVEQLETHCRESEPSINLLRSIEAVFLAKCLLFCLEVKEDYPVKNNMLATIAEDMLRHLQAINCNAYEIVENVWDESTHVWEPRNVGGAIYTTVSLVNHACYPNVVRHSYPRGAVVVRALRSIKKGSEILDCYGPHFLSESKLARREYLWRKYRFMCACDACVNNWQLPLPEPVGQKCDSCASLNYPKAPTNNGVQKTTSICCTNCRKKIDWKKWEKQLRKSVEKREKAASKMYNGSYQEALPLLLEHEMFVEKHLAAPNMEAIKTQQCIIQCYNYFSCTSK